MDIRKRISIVLVALLALVGVSAQAQTVSGTLIDGQHKQPLDYAVVQLLGSDSTYVSGTTSDDTGRFALAAPRDGRYILKVSFVGMRTLCHDVVAERAHTDEGDLEDVAAVARGGKGKAACVVARRARDVGAVRSQQLDDGVVEGLLVLAVDERARDGLCLGRDAHQGQECHQDYTDSLSYIHLVLV